jgi:ketosteroid isomerase-like protein
MHADLTDESLPISPSVHRYAHAAITMRARKFTLIMHDRSKVAGRLLSFDSPTGEAYGRGDVTRLLELVHPDLEWTYLDPSFENPQPQVCHGRDQLAWVLGRQADRGVNSELEEIHSGGDKVMVVVHTPGVDQHREWQGNDRNYLVLTLRQGQVVAMRAFRDLDAVRGFTSEGGQR